MTWGAVAVAGVGLVGSVMSSNAAGKAADQQAQSTAQSNALQQYMFDQNRALQMPTINTGNAARDRLSYLLGLSPTGYSGGNAGGGSAPTLTYDQLRSQLLSQYTKSGASSGASNPLNLPPPTSEADAYNQMQQYAQYASTHPSGGVGSDGQPYGVGQGPGYWEPGSIGTGADEAGKSQRWVSTANQSTSQIDESGLDAEIKRRLAEQDAARQAQIDAAKNDPNYGRLAQQFQFDTYTPDKFSYTGEDLYKDPSYQFRLEQGQKALDRQGAAAGRFLSGRQLQASSNYNQGAASQEFQNAYSRALGTFSTNEGNRSNAFNTNQGNRFNAYQANFNNSVNPLLALSGAATLGSQNLGSAGAAYAGQVGNNLTNQANATGAAGIASANTISSGLTGAVNGYQQNQLLNSLLNRGSVNNNPSSGLGGLDASTVYGAGSGWGSA
jgi:hypothetical protein